MKIFKFKKLITFFIAVIVMVPALVYAANNFVLNGDVFVQLTTTNTTTQRTITMLNGGTAVSLDINSTYIDITLENLSNISFQAATSITMDVVKQSGTGGYGISNNCSTNVTQITGQGSVVLRLSIRDAAVACGGGGGSSVTPSNLSLEINGGTSCTSLETVTLTIEADDANQVVIGNDPNFYGSSWESFSSPMTKQWDLTSDDGQKTVYAKFKSSTNNLSTNVTANITLDKATNCGQSSSGTSGGGGGGGGSSTTPSTTTTTTETTTTTTNPVVSSTPGESTYTQTEPVTDVEKELNIIPGDVIKGSKSTLYLYDVDLKRHTYPTAKTYFTWHSDFSKVKTISDSLLYKLPLGKNVRYKAGGRMLKIQTDPKVYAVENGGVLRWIKTEEVAKALYGPNWNKFIDDIGAAFFMDYTIGDPITDASQYTVLIDTTQYATASVPAPAKTCSTSTTFTSFMNVGSSGSEVKAMQELLQCLGHISASTEIAGYYGEATESAVISFQKEKGVDAVGYVGPGTRVELNKYTK